MAPIAQEPPTKKRKRKKDREILYNENRPRYTTLSTQNGFKTLTFLSMIPDHLLTTERQNDVLRELQNRKYT